MQDLTKNAEAWRDLNKLTDEQLAGLLAKGEDDALAVLFDRHSRLLFSIALNIVRDPGEAEEVMQTVFFDFYRALANFDPQKGMLKVWLLQYAYHRALNRRRHLEANLFYKWVDLNLAGQEPSLSRDPHAVIEAAQLMERLLGSLSSRRRSIIELTYFEGLTAEEIAVKLGESVSAVRHELYRGLARLRERMAKQTKQAAGNTAEAKEALRPNAQAI